MPLLSVDAKISRLLLWGQRFIESGHSWVLAPLSGVWALVVHSKKFLYDRGWLPVVSVRCPVLSIGNLVAGGTGKTPLVHLLAAQFAHRRVAILSSGYGAIPDEALLLQKRLPHARVYIGKDRARLALKAEAEGAELILLDDGLQYRKLARTWDWILFSGHDPWGRGHYLPWGFLRDTPQRLKGAQLFFVILPCTASFRMPAVCQGRTIFLRKKIERLADWTGQCLPSIYRLPIAFFCGIAHPASFRQTLLEAGALIIAEWILADHQVVDLEELHAFAHRAKIMGAQWLLCTEKDAVRFPQPPSTGLPVGYVSISLHIEQGDALWRRVFTCIEDAIVGKS
jgi:tetraacyldisaccharide 4'-kinase